MMKKIIIFMMLILIVGCTTPVDIIDTHDIADTDTSDVVVHITAGDADDSQAAEAGVQAVIDANNQFAIDYYNFIKSREDNIFFSPYSISTALAMTYEGARGKTAEEMKNVFGFPDDRLPSYARLYNLINDPDKEYTLDTANSLWAQKDYKFLQDFFDIVDTYYKGGVTNLDFKENPEGSRVIINDWVEEKTRDKIKDLIPPGLITVDTRLVLTNAIYFKGDWLTEFDKKDTKEADFFVDDSKTVKAQMMFQKQDFPYYEDQDVQVLELPYKGEELSMLVLLPKGDESDLSKLSEYRNMLHKQEVNVYLPKFKLETKYFMKQDFSNMGMPTAFTPLADFSGMTGDKDLRISQVIHQAFVELDEEGTEAAASTAVIMTKTSARMPAIFRADHPFVFLIQDKLGNILFIGELVDPS